MHTLVVEVKPNFDKAIEFLTKELSSLRTGRANPMLVENLEVEAYGSRMAIKGLASIGVPDAKTVTIEPWDKTMVKAVEKAIIEADIGLAPNIDGGVIRLNMPQMTEENRKHLVKKMKEKLEEARVRLRGAREELKEKIVGDEKNGKLPEDEKYKALEDLDKLTKEFMGTMDQMAESKEQEIMTV